MTADTPLQTILSLVAVAAWTYAVVRADGPLRGAYSVVWLVTLLLAASSLTYLDAVPDGAAMALQLAARLVLVASGAVVAWQLLRPHLEPPP